VICLLAIVVFIREPERGGAEREKGEIVADVVASSYLDDLRSLATKYLMRTGYGPFHYVKTQRSDAIVCGLGALIAVPTLFFAIHEIPHSMALCWVLMFICITATCFNWATNVDMLMAVVVPTRRNAANSWQILISHLCGDASGPYILGLVWYSFKL
ncbi:hypothetical protein TELCIR_20625, partial [Teladorsagia circumcincta]